MLLFTKSAFISVLAARALQADARPVTSSSVVNASHQHTHESLLDEMPWTSVNSSTPALQRREDTSYSFVPPPGWEAPDWTGEELAKATGNNINYGATRGNTGDAFAKLIVLAIESIREKLRRDKEKDLEARRKLTSETLDEMIAKFPGWHAFVYIESKNFLWYIDEPEKGCFQAAFDYKRQDGSLQTERYRVVAFAGKGHIDKNGYDGGFENWAYLGGERNDQRVDWY